MPASARIHRSRRVWPKRNYSWAPSPERHKPLILPPIPTLTPISLPHTLRNMLPPIANPTRLALSHVLPPQIKSYTLTHPHPRPYPHHTPHTPHHTPAATPAPNPHQLPRSAHCNTWPLPTPHPPYSQPLIPPPASHPPHPCIQTRCEALMDVMGAGLPNTMPLTATPITSTAEDGTTTSLVPANLYLDVNQVREPAPSPGPRPCQPHLQLEGLCTSSSILTPRLPEFNRTFISAPAPASPPSLPSRPDPSPHHPLPHHSLATNPTDPAPAV